MKKILMVVSILFLTISVNAQSKMMHHKMGMKNCVMMKDGKMMVMKDGNTMMMDKDMTMSNGTMVMTDGNVKMKNGKMMMLKEGDCVMMDGKMTHMSNKKKMSNKSKM